MGERIQPNEDNETLANATLFVIQAELEYLTRQENAYNFLLDLLPEAQHHAEGCGCHQCWLQFENLLGETEVKRAEFESEYERVFIDTPDHEEQFINSKRKRKK